MFLLLLITGSLSFAQDDEGTNIQPGGVFTGEITDRNPRAVYYFDGQRGEVILFRLLALSGTLDPVLTIFDSAGMILLRRDDDSGSANIEESFVIDHNDRYFVSVERFGGQLGSTTGSFELTLDRSGVICQSGSALRYGDSCLNTITNLQPQVYYTFEAQAGDIINIQMERNSSSLDPYLQVLQVVDNAAYVVADNDDVPGSGTKNALIEGLLIKDTGTYIIVATRYSQAAGDSVGNFVLTLSESANSGLGNSAAAPFPLEKNQVVEASLSDDRYERFYSFLANQDDLVTIRMERTSGQLDSYIILANAGFQPLLEDDDGGNGKNALISRYRIPADGLYHIIATRFERAIGTTAGGFRLQLESNGSVYAGVPDSVRRIVYGTSTTGTINDEIPEELYAFWGSAGDAITISMTRGDGDLDPVLELLNDRQERLLRNDDSTESQNARIDRYILQYTGIHYIRTTRYSGQNGNPNTRGSYLLVLALRFD